MSAVERMTKYWNHCQAVSLVCECLNGRRPPHAVTLLHARAGITSASIARVSPCATELGGGEDGHACRRARSLSSRDTMPLVRAALLRPSPRYFFYESALPRVCWPQLFSTARAADMCHPSYDLTSRSCPQVHQIQMCQNLPTLESRDTGLRDGYCSPGTSQKSDCEADAGEADTSLAIVPRDASSSLAVATDRRRLSSQISPRHRGSALVSDQL